MRRLALLALAIPLLATAAPDTPPAPQTVALLAAIGDRIEVVRQLKLSSRPGDPYRRKAMQVSSQELNYAVLRGLDRALTEDEPEAKHVLLQWNMPADLAERVQKARGNQRQDLVVDALTEHLKSLPERQQWDRIEVIVPAYTYLEMQGIGTKLSGIGVYIQPLAHQVFDLSNMADGSAMMSITTTDTEGDYRTINPKTGETGHSATYVASYMYFEHLTFDAKTMALTKRQRFFDNTKYADPTARVLDVSDQMTNDELLGKVVDSVERSAYKAIRPLTGEVTMSIPKEAPAPASAPASGSR